MVLVSGPNTGTISPQWTKSKRWMHDCGSAPSSLALRSDACTTGCLDGLLAFGCSVEWRGTQGTCISPVRMRQYMMREHKHRHLRLLRIENLEENWVGSSVKSRAGAGWIGCLGSEVQAAEFVIDAKKWTPNGHELLELLRSNQLVAILTHGEANRQCWTWLSPFKTRHRLDNMITRKLMQITGK